MEQPVIKSYLFAFIYGVVSLFVFIEVMIFAELQRWCILEKLSLIKILVQLNTFGIWLNLMLEWK